MFDFSNFNIYDTFNAIIGALASTMIISGTSALFKIFKSDIKRKKFFKRLSFYNSILGLIIFTYNLLSVSFFPTWFCVLIIILSIFNLSYDFENSIKKTEND